MSYTYIHTGGSHREIGFDIGRATADAVKALVRENPRFYAKETKRALSYLKRFVLRNYLPYGRRLFPQLVEELEGMAEGAGVPFDEIALFAADEEVTEYFGAHRDKCTSAAVRSSGRMFLLHNEDYLRRYMGQMVIVRAEPSDEPSFMSLCYPGMHPGSSSGFNEHGIAFGNDSLNFRPKSAGLPKNFIFRRLLECRRAVEVKKVLATGPLVVAYGITFVSADENRGGFFERIGRQCVQTRMEDAGRICHTNHALSPVITDKGERVTWSSRLRLDAVDHLLAKAGSKPSLSDLEKTLSSQDPYVLQATSGNPFPTLASVVIDASRRRMFVCDRAKKGNKFEEYRL